MNKLSVIRNLSFFFLLIFVIGFSLGIYDLIYNDFIRRLGIILIGMGFLLYVVCSALVQHLSLSKIRRLKDVNSNELLCIEGKAYFSVVGGHDVFGFHLVFTPDLFNNAVEFNKKRIQNVGLKKWWNLITEGNVSWKGNFWGGRSVNSYDAELFVLEENPDLFLIEITDENFI